MLFRHKHFHYGLARSFIIILLLLLGVYGMTLLVPGLKLVIAGRLGVDPKVLGVKTKNPDPQQQLKEDIAQNIETIKDQPIQIRVNDVLATLSRSGQIIKDGKAIFEYVREEARKIKLPKAPEL